MHGTIEQFKICLPATLKKIYIQSVPDIWSPAYMVTPLVRSLFKSPNWQNRSSMLFCSAYSVSPKFFVSDIGSLWNLNRIKDFVYFSPFPLSYLIFSYIYILLNIPLIFSAIYERLFNSLFGSGITPPLSRKIEVFRKEEHCSYM